MFRLCDHPTLPASCTVHIHDRFASNLDMIYVKVYYFSRGLSNLWSSSSISFVCIVIEHDTFPPILLFIYLFISLKIYLSTYPSFSISLYFSLSLYLSISLSLYLVSLYLSISISLYLSISLSLYLSISISLYLYIS